MIDAMRTLALDFLFSKLGDKDSLPNNLEDWYQKLRNDQPEELFPFLVESGENIEKLYVVEQATKDTLRLTPEDMTDEKAKWLPFMRPSGSQGAQVGPVIKRSTGGGPSVKILKTTMDSFDEIANADEPWSDYFSEIIELLNNPMLTLQDGSIIEWKNDGYENLLAAAVDKIGEQKKTVFLAVRDRKGNLPGQRREYLNYLMLSKLGGTRYVTVNTPEMAGKNCPLCGKSGVTVFPNALKGAGINLSNVDRVGAFPGIDLVHAWKRYALCNACADLLYIYKFYVLKKNSDNRNPYMTPIAGETAVVIPFTTIACKARLKINRAVKDFTKNTHSNVGADESTILDILKTEKGILNLTFLWATVGQNIEKVTGLITDVPPSRLSRISEINENSREWRHALFPEAKFYSDKKINFRPDLSFSALRSLFYQPVASMNLRQLKRIIVTSVYHKTEIPIERFWHEIMSTARWYWLDAIKRDKGYLGLLYEGRKKTGEHYLTAAGWIKHLCWWLYYFKELEVIKMEGIFYEPYMEKLKPYFGAESGIDSPQKAYAFLLGVLYGKVLQVQGARGVNVGANALTWLKRLTLKGRDLPELYVKVREKLLAYDAERNEEVRDLIKEIGRVGVQLGDKIELDEIPANYYLLLGQSLTTTVLPKKEDKKDG